MKLINFLISDHISGVILYILVLLANIDYTGILDYGLKAFLGGLIWFGFKILGEYLLLKLNAKHSPKSEQPPKQE